MSTYNHCNENWVKTDKHDKREQAKKNVQKTEGEMIPHPKLKGTWIIKKPENPALLICMGLIVLSMMFASCCSLQSMKEYKHYPKNESWGK